MRNGATREQLTTILEILQDAYLCMVNATDWKKEIGVDIRRRTEAAIAQLRDTIKDNPHHKTADVHR